MTEAEMFEMAAMYISNSITAFSAYLTIVFAYLAATYFVGANLSRIQTTILTVLFVVASTVTLMTFRTQSIVVIHFQSQLSSINDVFTLGNAPVAHYLSRVIIPLFGAGIFASLFFMFDIRRRAKKAS